MRFFLALACAISASSSIATAVAIPQPSESVEAPSSAVAPPAQSASDPSADYPKHLTMPDDPDWAPVEVAQLHEWESAGTSFVAHTWLKEAY